ncbi:hypothetical protein [Flavihumibacter solisilvae]|uniref:Lipocalin-like domain-containing protein n=1 Tax=Flavihumibacter solisilvae TaxID=1349421 RepID=A0A0C1ID52_9BACT|nr:hypothetical protein [Flavihumibacter solisilvae]KIC91950.1 hypothetical protein OI18_22195 [Flavihumibacter solisilvae]
MNIKRNLLTAAILISVKLASAQDCKLHRTTDDFSGKPKVTTGFIEFDNAQLTIDATGREIDYFFVIRNRAANCIGDQSEALFQFAGVKTKIELRNTGGDNCNGFFHILMKGGQYTPAAVQKLSKMKVASITFTDRYGKKTIVELSPEQQDILLKASDCIAKEAKTLER